MHFKRKSDMKGHNVFLSIAATLFCLLLLSCGHDGNRLDGRWKLIREKSASIDPWVDLVLEIRTKGTHVSIVKRYLGGNSHDHRVDSMMVDTKGSEEIISLPPGRWLGEVSMGLYYGPETKRHVLGRINESQSELHIDTRETLETAQGETEVEVKETYTLASDGSSVQLSENRSTRRSGPPLAYTFSRATQ
jgi:hypothetical protein